MNHSFLKTTLGAAGLGAASIICLQQVKNLVIENHLMKEHLRQMAEEEAIKRQLISQMPVEEGQPFGFARALSS